MLLFGLAYGEGRRVDKKNAELIRAVEKQNRGDLAGARAGFEKILQKEPGNYLAHYSLGVLDANAGRAREAHARFDRVLALNGAFHQARLNRSLMSYRLGDRAAALDDVEQCLAVKPDWPEAIQQRRMLVETGEGAAPDVADLVNTGLAQHNAGQIDQARETLLAVLARDPANYAALYSLGVITSQQGQHALAADLFARACQAQPDNATAFFARGAALQACGLYEAALAMFDQAIAIDPKFESSYANKSSLLHSLGRQRDALAVTEASLKVNPGNLQALNNRGYLLTEFKLFSQAADTFGVLLRHAPDYDYALGLKLFAQLHACDWSTFEDDRTRIIDGVRARKPVMNPLAFNAICDNAADIRLCAEEFAARKFPPQGKRLWNGEVYLHRKKRVALISADFREHPVGYLLIGLLEQMQRGRVELYAVSLGIRDKSELERRFRYAFDHFLDCSQKQSDEIARMLRDMEIDVAIDLSGYTSGARLDILAFRPAPVQATYLGYPGTLGCPYVDYIIADPVTIPERLQSAYSEKVVRLPHCYLPRDNSLVIPEREEAEKLHDLPPHSFLYASFNHDYKINPPVFAVWMNLLKKTPGSLLWLMRLNEDAYKNIAESARAHGVDPERILFASRVPRVEDHLARYRLVDVALDTFPYNGHTTTSDALSAGCPVVTLAGESFASRVASSLLTDVGLDELITTDLIAYERAASRFAEDPDYARGIRARLAETLASGAWPPSSAKQAEALERVIFEMRPV